MERRQQDSALNWGTQSNIEPMKTPLCDLLGIEFPLFAFSHCRDVVAAVSNAGGFGVLGASRHTPEELELELKWIDEHVHGRPYGVDVLIPENMVGRDGSVDIETLRARVPERHKEFVQALLARYGVTLDLDDPRVAKREMPLLPAVSARLLDVAFSHPIKLIANALGVPPQSMIDRARAQGVPVAALVGAKEHAVRQVQAGVDIIVAEGAEAGGHCGEVSTLVLVPEVIRAIQPIRPVPVLAAGGIVTGRQMAAMMALGAAGAWTGTVWLMTSESEASPLIQQKFAAATSRDTVRSKSRTGKYTRQLRSAWTDAWSGPDSPGPLPMPLQLFLSEPALRRAEHDASRGNRKAEDLVTYYVGQGVGLLDQVKTSRAVVREFMEEFAEAADDMAALTK
jgi:NAD(P)H-dependent flavin oxidoreductase YrpB (nitropropane dioxygenase family)